VEVEEQIENIRYSTVGEQSATRLKIKQFFGRVYFRKKEVQGIKLNSGAELAPELLSKM
jgi:hypothetical protein